METNEIQVAIDQQKVQKIVSSFELPPEIERIETRYGRDHTGDASVFLTFHIRDDVKVNTEGIKRLSAFLSAVTSALLNSNVGGFAYTRLEQAA
jgi:hypothetical protein